MEEKQIDKWLRRRFSGIGWMLVAYLGILNLLAALSMALTAVRQIWRAAAARDFGFTIDLAAIQGDAWGYILTIAVGFTVLWAWKGRDYWKEEILAKERSMGLPDFLRLLCLCVGAQFVNDFWIGLLETVLNWFGMSAMSAMEAVSGASDTFSMFLYASILGPIAEEVLYRGLILRTLRPFGKRFAILTSAILFGMYHGNLLQTPYAVVLGLVFGYVTVEYSVYWAMALHVFNNLVLADLLTRLTAPLPEALASAVILGIFGAFALAGVVILVCRRRQIGAYHRSEWMDRRCLKCFFTNSGVLTFLALTAASMISLLFV